MPITTCPDCSQRVSTIAETCPHCGRPGPFATPIAEAPALATGFRWKSAVPYAFAVLLFGALVIAGKRPASDFSAAALAETPLSVPADFQISLAEEAVKTRMKDPESVRFSGAYLGLVMQGKTGAAAVCGYVNAKNGFGGYSGDSRFIAAGDLAFLEQDMAPREFEKSWTQMCSR